jgi:hypothetical protein
MRFPPLFLAFLLAIVIPLWPQAGSSQVGRSDDPALLVGLTLNDLIQRFGIPNSVHAVRGLEEWQDDVVFVYDEGDFYILNDRVWHIGLKSAYLIRTGDPRSAVSLSFGQALRGGTDYAIFSLQGYNWPLALRFNFDSAGRVSAIFIYRSDL